MDSITLMEFGLANDWNWPMLDQPYQSEQQNKDKMIPPGRNSQRRNRATEDLCITGVQKV